MTYQLDYKKLVKWFLEVKRSLPWREEATPYGIWVSEIMLQQTQVAVVIPYYLRWMARFPSIESLAEASPDEVIKMWEGLGYYSRARNLHAGARYIVENHGGELPSSSAELAKIKGIGAYTMGAILNFAFRKRYPAVDGNVLRVLTRYFSIEDDISSSKTLKKIQMVAHAILPEESPWHVSEALIELGATVCQKKPQCHRCPLQASCQAFAKGSTELLPVKSAKVKTETLHRAVAVIRCGDKILFKRIEKGKIMSDLHEFPYFELTAPNVSPECVINMVKEQMGNIPVGSVEPLPKVKHSFTRFQVNLYPFLITALSTPSIEDYRWHPLETLHDFAFSSGHRRILKNL